MNRIDKCKMNRMPLHNEDDEESDDVIGKPLSASSIDSYGYTIVNKNLPIMLTNVIREIRRITPKLEELFTEKVHKDINDVTAAITKLLNDMKTNSEITELRSNKPDAVHWNEAIREAHMSGCGHFYNASLLLVELYVYRKLDEILENTEFLGEYDLFRHTKRLYFDMYVGCMVQFGQYFVEILHHFETENNSDELRSSFIKLLKLSLWNSEYDLTVAYDMMPTRISELMLHFDSKLIVDHTENMWDVLTCPSVTDDVVAIVLGKTGIELFSDLCLADFLISFGLSKIINFHMMMIPCLAKYVTTFDFHFIIEKLNNSSYNNLVNLGTRWNTYINEGQWTLQSDFFWSLPYTYDRMATSNSVLYDSLKLTKLIIFQGELHFRKLVRDIYWPPNTEFEVALGDFNPSIICVVTTITYGVVCNVEDSVVERISSVDVNWQRNGYGIVLSGAHSKEHHSSVDLGTLSSLHDTLEYQAGSTLIHKTFK